MTMRVETKRDDAGRLDHLTIYKGKARRGVELQFIYGIDGYLREIEFTGKKEDMPDVPSIIELINEKFMERLGNIGNIERIGNIANTPLTGRIMSEEKNFVERWEYLHDETNRRDFFFMRYTGRSYPYSPIWKSEIATDPTLWNIPNFILDDAPASEGAGWRNVVNMTNSKDGVTVDECYIQPRMVFHPPCIMRITAKFPASIPAGGVVMFGFEVNSQGGRAIYAFYITDMFCGLASSCMTPTECPNSQSAAVTLTDQTNYHTFHLDYDPPHLRLWGWNGTAQVLLGTLTITGAPSAFDCVSPFITNESSVVVTGYCVGHWACWQRKAVEYSQTPVIYNVTMTSANTEYSQALPANTKKFLVHTRDGTAFRLAFVTGKVAAPTEPYFTIDGVPYWEDHINPALLTLYFACASAGKVVEIIAWS